MDPMSGLAPSPEEEKKMAAMIEGMQTRDSLRTVSYTHLTLPTKA